MIKKKLKVPVEKKTQQSSPGRNIFLKCHLLAVVAVGCVLKKRGGRNL